MVLIELIELSRGSQGTDTWRSTKETDPNVWLSIWQHGGGDVGTVVLVLCQPAGSTTEETCAAASQADRPVHDWFTNKLPAHRSHWLG